MTTPKKVWGLNTDKSLYRLRWRFDFSDDKRSRFGIWNNSGALATDGAWCVNKTNLLRAAIEAEDTRTWETVALWECDGSEFVNFEWMAGAPMGSPFSSGTVTLRSTIVGMAGISRDFRCEVFVDGSSRRRERSEHDKKNILAAWKL